MQFLSSLFPQYFFLLFYQFPFSTQTQNKSSKILFILIILFMLFRPYCFFLPTNIKCIFIGLLFCYRTRLKQTIKMYFFYSILTFTSYCNPYYLFMFRNWILIIVLNWTKYMLKLKYNMLYIYNTMPNLLFWENFVEQIVSG